jgi:SAM-dependent methyltransferase
MPGGRLGWALRKLPVLIISFPQALFCLAYAAARKLPGLRFDMFGRSLALKRLFRAGLFSNISLFLTPVGGIRYFEFDFADRCLQNISGKTLLDISSPRLFPFWVAARQDARVTMVNPDPLDVQESKSLLGALKNAGRVEIRGAIFATTLPFADNSFDYLSCISVIEHLNGREDTLAIDEFVRVVKPGGKIILTFPVNYRFFEEFRSSDPYGTQRKNNATGLYFFQRFYDEANIKSRLLSNPNLKVIKKEYFVEKTVGWFNRYVKNWQEMGLGYVVKDPLLMVNNFTGPTPTHPADRVGNCHLLIEVTKS